MARSKGKLKEKQKDTKTPKKKVLKDAKPRKAKVLTAENESPIIEKLYDNKIINMIFVVFIAIFMLVVPFYRGLFFRVNYIPAIVFLSMVFAIYMLYRLWDKSFMTIHTYLDIFVLLIPISYLISFFFAANYKDAFDMLLIYTSYFMIYKITGSLIESDRKYKDIFVNTIIASTFLLSVTGILHLMGGIELQGVIVGKRFFGLYQYPNTTASVLGTGIILTVNMLIDTDNLKLKGLYQAVLTALISTFIFTLSRGAYLVLAGVMVINFLLINSRSKLKYMLSILVSFLSSSMLIYKYYTLAEEEIKAIGNHYFISIFISAIIIYTVFAFKDRIKIKISDKSINIALISILIVFAVIFGTLFSIKEPIEYSIEHGAGEEVSWKNKPIDIKEIEQDSDYTVEFNVKSTIESDRSYGIIIRSYNEINEHEELLNIFEPVGTEFTYKSFNFSTLEDTDWVRILIYNYETDSETIYRDVIIKDAAGLVVQKMDKLKYIPEAIASRLKDISFETSSSSLRILFAKDGLKIIKDYIITGAGGGAWKNLYRQYQTQPYNTTETHNFYVQYATEVGIIGLIALVGVIGLLLQGTVKSIKDKSRHLHIYLAAILLLIHSTIDFNLSLVAVGYILWMLIGITNSHDSIKAIDKTYLRYSKYGVLVLSIVIVFFSTSIYYGMKLGGQAVENATDNKDIEKAIELFQRASKYDKYNTVYRYDLAQILNNQLRKTKDKKYYDSFMDSTAIIKKYEPYNHDHTPIICSMFLAIGEFEKANELTEKRIQHQPMVLAPYIMKIDVNYQIAKYYLEKEEIEESVPYLEKALEAVKQLEEINEKIDEPMKFKGDYPKKIEAIETTLEMIKEDFDL